MRALLVHVETGPLGLLIAVFSISRENPACGRCDMLARHRQSCVLTRWEMPLRRPHWLAGVIGLEL
jgi:hypothetical protein